MFPVASLPQIASIQTWRRTGGSTVERWNVDGDPPDARGIADDHGRLMVVMVHNSDIPDPWERAKATIRRTSSSSRRTPTPSGSTSCCTQSPTDPTGLATFVASGIVFGAPALTSNLTRDVTP
jgi:hypothetical protein